MKIVAAAAVSLLVGLGLGYLAFHDEPLVERVETNTVNTIAVPTPGKTVVIEVPAAKPQPAVAPPSSAPPSLPPAQEVVALRAKVQELEAALKIEAELRQGIEGEKVPVPAGLPARLRDEKLLVSSFNTALKEAGFPGQVSNVDCSEHPCIVFGNGFGERGDLEKLLPTSGFAPYAKDSMSTFGFMRGAGYPPAADPDPGTRFFGVAVMPPGAEPSEELRKRIAFRVHQMEEVSRPQKK